MVLPPRESWVGDDLLIQGYDAHASLYADVLDPTLKPVADRLAALVDPDGARVLDLATGTGAVARALARRGASVVGVDNAIGMLAAAREHSPELDFREADAAALPFEDQSFDCVTCGLSVSHFADRRAVFGEVLRVLRPGGRFGVSTWGRGGQSVSEDVSEVLNRYALRRAGGLDEETWSNAARGSDALREAGFSDVSATTESFSGRFGSPNEVLTWALAWPLRAAAVAQLNEDQKRRLRAEAKAALQGRDLAWTFVFNFFAGLKR